MQPKILLDSCVWGGAAAFLRTQGYEVDSVAEWSGDPGDEEILRHANNSDSVLVTIDKDFGQLAIYRGHPHCGIVRLVNLPARQQAVVCHQVISRYESELNQRAIITAELGRVRIRKS